MLGYVTVNREILNTEDYDVYKAYYCGLCQALKKQHGQAGRLTLNYDMTFLYLLLTGLYEPEETVHQSRCLPHPVRPHREIWNPMAAYCADMNVLLAYYDLLDDWEDERKRAGWAAAAVLKKNCKRVEQQYPRQAAAVRSYLKDLHSCEAKETENLDEAAGLSGRMLAEILVYREDEWASFLRQTGFYLGKFIYLCDAYEDLEKDDEAGRYNPWKSWIGRPDLHRQCGQVLQSMMAECARNFEKLPILKHTSILRNILYSGIWSRYEMVGRKKEKGTGDHERSL